MTIRTCDRTTNSLHTHSHTDMHVYTQSVAGPSGIRAKVRDECGFAGRTAFQQRYWGEEQLQNL